MTIMITQMKRNENGEKQLVSKVDRQDTNTCS